MTDIALTFYSLVQLIILIVFGVAGISNLENKSFDKSIKSNFQNLIISIFSMNIFIHKELSKEINKIGVLILDFLIVLICFPALMGLSIINTTIFIGIILLFNFLFLFKKIFSKI